MPIPYFPYFTIVSDNLAGRFSEDRVPGPLLGRCSEYRQCFVIAGAQGCLQHIFQTGYLPLPDLPEPRVELILAQSFCLGADCLHGQRFQPKSIIDKFWCFHVFLQ